VSETIHVPVGSAREGHDLARALAVRGIVGSVVVEPGAARVEVVSGREPTAALLAETRQAVAQWCLDLGLEPRPADVVRPGGEPAPGDRRPVAA
jgi:hypothetical protein